MGKRYVLEVVLHEDTHGDWNLWTDDFDPHDVKSIFNAGYEVLSSILSEWGFDVDKNCTIVPKKMKSTDIDRSVRLPYGFRFTDESDDTWIEYDPSEQAVISCINVFLESGLSKAAIKEALIRQGLYSKGVADEQQ